MKKASTLNTVSLFAVSALIILGCAKAKEEEVIPSTGSTTAFTAADIVKSGWTSNCISKTVTALGTTQSKITLTLNANGTFSFTEYLYQAPSGGTSCASGDYTSIFMISGTYTVGSSVTGGQALNFTLASNPAVMVANSTPSVLTATQDKFNTDCGGTSPYCTLSSGSCTNNSVASGVSKNSSSMLCQNLTFPVNGNTLYNVGNWDGTYLSIGANTTGVPGVFSSGSIPSSATITLH